MKLRSLGLSPFVLAFTVGLAGAASTGCFFTDDHGSRRGISVDNGGSDGNVDNSGNAGDTSGSGNTGDTSGNPDKTPDAITQVSIQPDQTLKAAPGEGVGIFVEYTAPGKWHVWTTCDTFSSKSVCNFDIFAGASHPIQLRTYTPDTLEGPDEAKDLGDGTVELLAETDSDTDGLYLEMEDNTPLNLEVYLDGNSAESFVYWVSNDVIHAGAPANPVSFVPQLSTTH